MDPLRESTWSDTSALIIIQMPKDNKHYCVTVLKAMLPGVELLYLKSYERGALLTTFCGTLLIFAGAPLKEAFYVQAFYFHSKL